MMLANHSYEKNNNLKKMEDAELKVVLFDRDDMIVTHSCSSCFTPTALPKKANVQARLNQGLTK